jgi:hypothetical protein
MRTIELLHHRTESKGGYDGAYEARFKDEPGKREAGTTPAEAVGELLISHPAAFGTVRVQDPAALGHAALPAVVTDEASASALGKLVLEHPDVFGVSIAILGADRWPKPGVKRRVLIPA